MKVHGTHIDQFIFSYIQALLWTSNEDEFPEYCYSGEFSISIEDVERISPDTLDRIIKDCAAFEDAVESALANWTGEDANIDQIDSYKAGHDFALTRNGCGSGFWDRDADVYGVEPRDTMNRIAKSFPEFNLYKGEDGLIYGE